MSRSSFSFPRESAGQRQLLRLGAARLAGDRSGATSTEYALIAALVSIIVLIGATDIGAALLGVFIDTSTALEK